MKIFFVLIFFLNTPNNNNLIEKLSLKKFFNSVKKTNWFPDITNKKTIVIAGFDYKCHKKNIKIGHTKVELKPFDFGDNKYDIAFYASEIINDSLLSFRFISPNKGCNGKITYNTNKYFIKIESIACSVE